MKNLLPETEKKALTEGNVVNVLKNKDHLGRRVLIVNCGKLWNPDEISADQMFKLFYLSKLSEMLFSFNEQQKVKYSIIFTVHIVAQLEKSSQINGVVVVMDFDGLGMKQVKALSPSFTQRLLTFIQKAMPLRLKEVHFVKQPFIFKMVWQLFKPFVQEKLKNRVSGK